MAILENKLENIYNKLNVLLLQFQNNIYTKNLVSLPNQIDKIMAGENKLLSYIDGTIREISESDLYGVTDIRSGAFYGRSNLESITIPASVTNMDSNVFADCANLANIYLYPTTPPSLADRWTLNAVTIHVPIGSGNAYKSATNWAEYADNIVEDIQLL